MYGTASFALFFLIFNTVYGLEPQCSPFHYQEQMIEKMVKLEIFVQKMKDDLTAIQQRVVNELESLDVFKKGFTSDFETEKTSINNVIQQLMNRNDALMQNISSTFQQMVEGNSDEMKKYAKEVEAIKDSAVTPTVVFFARDVSQTTQVSGATFIYKTIVVNEGSGYDSTTGRFTAPVGGTYLFTVQFCLSGGSSNYMYFAFVVDGTKIKRGYFADQPNGKCYTADVIVVLKAGAQIWVTSPTLYGSLWQDTSVWNTYSGVLLHK